MLFVSRLFFNFVRGPGVGKGVGAGDVPWHVTRRLLEFRGEERANLLRLVGLVAFYGQHLLNRYGLGVSGISDNFHAAITALAVAWAAAAAAVLLTLRNRIMPPSLKFIITGVDVLLLTSVLLIADGPQSPVVSVYFLLIALAGLRGSGALVWSATGGALLGYGVIVGQAMLSREALMPPTHHVLTTALALGMAGVITAQITGAIRAAAGTYAQVRRGAEVGVDDVGEVHDASAGAGQAGVAPTGEEGS